jgi:hypothetical protein
MPRKIDPAIKAAKAAEKEAAKAAKAAEKEAAKAAKAAEKEAAKAAKAAEKEAAKAAKAAEKEAARAAKKEAKVNKLPPPTVEDIRLFSTTSSREDNDAVNKKREAILPLLECVPAEYLEHLEYGSQWRALHSAWNRTLGVIAARVGGSPETPRTVLGRGGRMYNYDLYITFHLPDGSQPAFKCEFKHGCKTIDRLAQFLSLPVSSSSELIVGGKTYDQAYYDDGILDRMIACDVGITEAKPDRATYLREVKLVKSKHPFFCQLKEREPVAKEEKARIVDESIAAYLPTVPLNTEAFASRARTTQVGKIYLLWCDGAFHIDEFRDDDFNGITIKEIKGPHIYLTSGNNRFVFDLLLRWRNHKGILNPAWQIAARRGGV